MAAAFNVASLSTYNPLDPVTKVCATGIHLVFCEDVDPFGSYSFFQDAQLAHPFRTTDSLLQWVPGSEVQWVEVRGVRWLAGLAQQLSPNLSHAVRHCLLSGIGSMGRGTVHEEGTVGSNAPICPQPLKELQQ